MWLQVVVIFSTHYLASGQNFWGNKVCFSDKDCNGFTCDREFGCTRTLVGKTFWNTDICNSNIDCSGLTSCDPTFGCTPSFMKISLVMLSVFISLSVISCAIKWLIIRYRKKRQRHTNYVPQTTMMPPNPHLWNQYPYPLSTTMFHPQSGAGTQQDFNQHQPVTNDDPPSYNECRISVSPTPTAPQSEICDTHSKGH